jgi:hypothetical protein
MLRCCDHGLSCNTRAGSSTELPSEAVLPPGLLAALGDRRRPATGATRWGVIVVGCG